MPRSVKLVDVHGATPTGTAPDPSPPPNDSAPSPPPNDAAAAAPSLGPTPPPPHADPNAAAGDVSNDVEEPHHQHPSTSRGGEEVDNTNAVHVPGSHAPPPSGHAHGGHPLPPPHHPVYHHQQPPPPSYNPNYYPVPPHDATPSPGDRGAPRPPSMDGASQPAPSPVGQPQVQQQQQQQHPDAPYYQQFANMNVQTQAHEVMRNSYQPYLRPVNDDPEIAQAMLNLGSEAGGPPGQGGPPKNTENDHDRSESTGAPGPSGGAPNGGDPRYAPPPNHGPPPPGAPRTMMSGLPPQPGQPGPHPPSQQPPPGHAPPPPSHHPHSALGPPPPPHGHYYPPPSHHHHGHGHGHGHGHAPPPPHHHATPTHHYYPPPHPSQMEHHQAGDPNQHQYYNMQAPPQAMPNSQPGHPQPGHPHHVPHHLSHGPPHPHAHHGGHHAPPPHSVPKEGEYGHGHGHPHHNPHQHPQMHHAPPLEQHRPPLNAHAPKPETTTTEKKRKRPADMPRRPLSAYNFFFSEERERVLAAIPDPVKNEGDDGNAAAAATAATPSETKETAKLKEETEKKAASTALRLLQIRDAKVVRRRPHRKSHGKIAFKDLARTIGKRWRALDDEQKQKYNELAEKDLQRYNEQMKEYNSKRNRFSVSYQTAPGPLPPQLNNAPSGTTMVSQNVAAMQGQPAAAAQTAHMPGMGAGNIGMQQQQHPHTPMNLNVATVDPNVVPNVHMPTQPPYAHPTLNVGVNAAPPVVAPGTEHVNENTAVTAVGSEVTPNMDVNASANAEDAGKNMTSEVAGDAGLAVPAPQEMIVPAEGGDRVNV